MGAFDMLQHRGLLARDAPDLARRPGRQHRQRQHGHQRPASAPSRPRCPSSRPPPGGGVEVAGFALSDPNGRLVSDPDNPLADAEGYVRTPDIDLASQMTQLVMAQRGFQASVQVSKDAQDTYSSALPDRSWLMSIPGIEAVGFTPYVPPQLATSPLGSVSGAAATTGTQATGSAHGADFGNMVLDGDRPARERSRTRATSSPSRPRPVTSRTSTTTRSPPPRPRSPPS